MELTGIDKVAHELDNLRTEFRTARQVINNELSALSSRQLSQANTLDNLQQNSYQVASRLNKLEEQIELCIKPQPIPLPSNEGWLLEKKINSSEGNSGIPVWIGIIDGLLEWTPSANLAIRFARREDAEALATIVDDCESITSHSWI
jgi:hypothetical protein